LERGLVTEEAEEPEPAFVVAFVVAFEAEGWLALIHPLLLYGLVAVLRQRSAIADGAESQLRLRTVALRY
jgi:hypothetical protein